METELIAQILACVEMQEVKTSPPHLATQKMIYEADTRPGMRVYFSVHKSHDPTVGAWVAMTYPGRSFCDPPAKVLHNILVQLRAAHPAAAAPGEAGGRQEGGAGV